MIRCFASITNFLNFGTCRKYIAWNGFLKENSDTSIEKESSLLLHYLEISLNV